MVFYKGNRLVARFTSAGFTLVEAAIAISLVGVGIASTIGALTKVNSIASMSRNATGAYTVAMNQIDLILSDGPFNPQKKDDTTGTPLIPPELKLDSSRTPAGPLAKNNVPIYRELDAQNNVVDIVLGTMTTSIVDVSPAPNKSPYFYRATVTVTYTYLNRNYSFSMSTVRTSDI
jgi:type II secretory pathway pseudopilin PulG